MYIDLETIKFDRYINYCFHSPDGIVKEKKVTSHWRQSVRCSPKFRQTRPIKSSHQSRPHPHSRARRRERLNCCGTWRSPIYRKRMTPSLLTPREKKRECQSEQREGLVLKELEVYYIQYCVLYQLLTGSWSFYFLYSILSQVIS